MFFILVIINQLFRANFFRKGGKVFIKKPQWATIWAKKYLACSTKTLLFYR